MGGARVAWVDVEGTPPTRPQMFVESIAKEDSDVAVHSVPTRVNLTNGDLLLAGTLSDSNYHVTFALERGIDMRKHAGHTRGSSVSTERAGP